MKTVQVQQYWAGRLALPLPVYFRTSKQAALTAGDDPFISIPVPAETAASITRATNGAAAGEYCYLLAALCLVVRQHYAADEILAVLPGFNTNSGDRNMLFIRQAIDPAATAKALLECTRATLLEAVRHQPFPADNAGRHLEEEDLALLYQWGIRTGNDNQYLPLEKLQVLIGYESNLVGHCLTIHAERLFTAAWCRTIATHLVNALEIITRQPSALLSEIVLLTPEEQHELLFTFNDTYKSLPLASLPALFHARALEQPGHIALRYRDQEYTYAGMQAKSTQVAQSLVQHYGVMPGDIVGIMLEAGPQMVISIFGVLQAGAAFMLLPAGDVTERIAYMLADSHAKVLIVQDGSEDIGTASTVSCNALLQAIPESIVLPSLSLPDIACVIYTSGSTGQPKGVCISHGNCCNMLYWFRDYFALTESDVFPQKTTVAFVDALVEILLPVTLTGGTVYLRPHDDVVQDPPAFLAWMEAIGTTVMQFVPSAFDMLEELEDVTRLKLLRSLILSGEPVKRNYSLACNVYNLYGCSEATASSTVYHFTGGEIQCGIIGKPIYNTRVYILDAAMRLLPKGASGEMYIGGQSVVPGYLHVAGQHAGFVDDPFRPGEKCYRSGDLGRWLENGHIEHLGRLDHQLKFHGVRIEPAEIEQILLLYPGITHAFVLLVTVSSAEELVAYLKYQDACSLKDLRSFLAGHLPAYMLPTFFVTLHTLPLTATGKVNRRLLPDPLAQQLITTNTFAAPQTELEEKLAMIWEDVLQYKPLGRDDNFFEHGGQSLKAMKVVSWVYKSFEVQLGLRAVFDAPTIASFAALVKAADKKEFVAIMPAPAQELYACSRAQRRLWMLAQIEAQHLAYNMLSGYVFEGDLDEAAFKKAFQHIVCRHEILRTTFVVADGEPLQKIHAADDREADLQMVDLSAATDTDAAVRRIADAEATHVFDLEKGPLLKMKLIRLGPGKYIFFFNIHHIISDGWTMRVLIQEVLTLYNAFSTGQEDPLLPMRIQYKDYALWQNKQLLETALQASRTFWLSQFADGIPVLDITTDYPRPAIKTYNGKVTGAWINPAVSSRLFAFAQAQGASVFMTVIAALHVLLYRYSGQEDIVIGTPVAGREHKDLEEQLGMYVNTLAIRTRCNASEDFVTLLQSVKAHLLEVYDHQSYPFDQLVDELDFERDQRRSPIFDVMAVLHNNEQSTGSGSGNTHQPITVAGYDTRSSMSKFDLSFSFVQDPERLFVELEYNVDLFSQPRMERLLLHFSRLLEILPDSRAPLYQLDYLSSTEKEILLQRFNNTAADNTPGITILNMFAEQVASTPAAVAVVSGHTTLSYEELDQRSGRLATYLQQTLRVKQGDAVGMMAERSEQMIIYVLAILKAGAVFVPLDPAYPQDRIQYLITDSGIDLLIADTANAIRLQSFSIPVLDPALQQAHTGLCAPVTGIKVLPAHHAYIIYTSGSTGLPKGVVVSHGNLLNIALGWQQAYCLKDFTVSLLQLASVAFDVFMGDVCRALLNGGKMVIVPSETRNDPEGLYLLLKQHEISIFESTPSLIIPLMDYVADQQDALSFLRILILGSDVCQAGDFRKLARWVGPEVRLLNSYGTTETTIDSSFYEMPLQALPFTGIVPVGKPMRNNRFYLLDANRQLLPVGAAGELFIGGAGVAQGYLHREALTETHFIPDPFYPGHKMYRTHDMACWSEDGQLKFLGRNDQQVKIRGYRIEPAEIEQRLLQHAFITAAIVTIHRCDEDPQLAAYVISDPALTEKEIRSYLRQHLPDYMVPAFIILLQEFPRNVNGKVNVNALPDPEIYRTNEPVQPSQPLTETEQLIVDTCSQVLRGKAVSLEDNFFAIGGDSIKAIKLVGAFQKKGYRLNMKDIFMHPELGAWVAVLRPKDKAAGTGVS